MSVMLALSIALALLLRPIELPPLVGAKAQSLSVEKWVRGPAVPAFRKGHVYVIDIWATWCGPCVGGMPHLTELQKRYASRGLTVIGLSSDDAYGNTREKVEKLVAEKGAGIGYPIAWDDHKKSYDRWMAVEKVSGWPWSFIIDRQGRVAYIGHPEHLDRALEQVIAGTYDLKAASARYKGRYDALLLGAAWSKHMHAKHWAEVLPDFEKIEAKDRQVAQQYGQSTYRVLVSNLKDNVTGIEFARHFITETAADNAGVLAQFASMILDPKFAGERDLGVALDAAARANALASGKDAGFQASLAAVYFARGEKANAILHQEKAVTLANPQDRPQMQKDLDRYRSG